MGLTAGSGDAIPSASASVTSRALTTALPNAKFTTLKSGVDTVVMRHRECNGACADTVIITVARTPKALRVEQGAGTIFAVGQTGQAIVIGALDSLGAITPVNGLGISTSAVTAGLTILAGGSGTMAAVETEEDTFAATGKIEPPVPAVIADVGAEGEKKRKKSQKKRDEAFEKYKQEQQELRKQIERAIDPMVDQANPVVVSEGRKQIEVHALDGSKVSVPVPLAFSAEEIGRAHV
mgnify:CR=1 FL=1